MRSALFIIPIFLLASCSFASEEIPVNVKADKLKYIEGTGIIEASGSVEVSFKEVRILADVLRMDSESNTATAEGNVKIITRDYSAVSNYILYDADQQVSTFSGFETSLYPSKMKGKLYVSAEELRDLGKKMLGEKGEITTCEHEIPHFFTTADGVEYYPEDKIIGYNVTLFVGGMPCLWMPVMVYDLSKKQKRNWVFGHNEVEGDYIKSSWGYPQGILYFDLIEKKGIGLGTENNYKLWGLGTLFLYHVSEGNTGTSNWVTRVNHTQQINEWTTLKLNHDYSATYLIPSGRRDQTSLGISLGYQDKARWNLGVNSFDDRIGALQKYSFGFDQAFEQISTNYNLHYDFSKKDPEWIRTSQSLRHHRPLWSDKVTLSTRANYYNNIAGEGEVGDQRLEPAFDITGRESGYSWRYSSNWYLDMDGDDYEGDNSYQYLEKLPEIEVTPDPVDVKLFTLRPRFGYGHYREVKYVSELGGTLFNGMRDFKSERYSVSLNADKQIPLKLGTVAILGAGLDQFFYAPGDQLYAYRENLSLRTNLGGFFRNDIDYRKGITDGNSPFLFDQLGTRYHDVRERMTFYYQNKFNWTLSTGRNWQTHKWFDLDTSLMLRPDEKVYLTSRTGWDIENTRYKDLINNLTLVPYPFLTLRLASVSDMNEGRLKSGSAVYDIYFLKNEPNQWYVRFNQIYEPASDQFKVRDIMIVKDLHCWELKYTYSDYRKEFSLTFSLKALPDEPVGVSTGRGFYMEGFERQIKELKPEGAIQRY